jgi:UDP-N-acetylglucosamine--N-acetylmuramyl-(pentapeptide) pyrophosphoryl-undecaprenol N-acetylglucosamine transferase
MTTLLVAATGGHLAQLHQLRPRLVPADEPVVWATFDGPQSRSLLAGERVEYVPYVRPRAYGRVAANSRLAWQILSRHQVRQVVSTGSGIALSFLPVARLRGLDVHYIESAARSDGPSATGRILSHVPGIRLSSQYDSWAGGKWQRTVSVFDDFAPMQRIEAVSVHRVVVTLGTIEGYGFRSLLERLIEVLPPGTDVLWQTGATDVSGLPIQAHASLPQSELRQHMQACDVVVAHAGIGSALDALQCGHGPILVPRRPARGEHVDAHQAQIAGELDRRGLAIHREVEDLTFQDLERAARLSIRRAQGGTADSGGTG